MKNGGFRIHVSYGYFVRLASVIGSSANSFVRKRFWPVNLCEQFCSQRENPLSPLEKSLLDSRKAKNHIIYDTIIKIIKMLGGLHTINKRDLVLHNLHS